VGTALGARPLDGRPTRTRPATDLLSRTHSSPDPGDGHSPGEYWWCVCGQVPDVYSLRISGHLGPRRRPAGPGCV